MRSAPAVIAYLKTFHPRVSTQLDTVLPAVRVTLVYSYEGNRYEQAPVYQIEAWADTEGQADILANQLWDEWPKFHGAWGNQWIIGAWTVSIPRPLPDPTTNKYRYMFEGGMRLG